MTSSASMLAKTTHFAELSTHEALRLFELLV